MLGDDPTVLTDHDAVGIGVNIDRPSDRARRHRLFVVVEAHQAGLRGRRWHGVESVEPADIICWAPKTATCEAMRPRRIRKKERRAMTTKINQHGEFSRWGT